MAPRRTYWDQPLIHRIRPADGPLDELVTLRDAAEFATALEPWRQKRPHWQYAGRLLLQAGTSGNPRDIEAATMQLRRALRVEGWL